MATNFPATLDTLTNPASTDYMDDVPHADQHANANDAIEALEAKVGVDSSAVTTSLDYKLKSTSSIDPGHKHTATGSITASATDKLLGRVSGGAGAVEEVTFTDFAQTIVAAASAAATRALLGLDTSDSPQLTAINVGHASDTTLSRKSAGVLQVEANELYMQGGTDVAVADGGTGASTAAAALANLGLSVVKLTAQQQFSATTTVADITGLSFPVVNGSYYRFVARIVYRSDTTTTGLKITITTPTFTKFSALAQAQTGADGSIAVTTGQITASADEYSTSGVHATGTDYIMTVEGIIIPSADGTVQFRGACEVASGVVSVEQGTVLEVYKYG